MSDIVEDLRQRRMDKAADTIESLRRELDEAIRLKLASTDNNLSLMEQLATMTAERNDLNEINAQWVANLATELAASQAREQQLREALKMAVKQNGHDMLMTGEELRKCEATLDLPHDDTALRQAKAKLLRDAADKCEDTNDDKMLRRMADELEKS